ncbi:SPFH/Band 7/PHB domain protein [Candidatus Bathyarchaeota archaeon]|nr:MAG: SPFH/Band 7/PHB domain protein [Candidatus Bathyarchaeota archaeon]
MRSVESPLLQVIPIPSWLILLIVFFVILLLAILAAGIKVVPEYRRLVVFRLGRFTGVRGPGLTFLIPGIDRGQWVDLRENFINVPHQTCITKDNAPVDIDFLIYYKVLDPAKCVLNVTDFDGAATGMATTILRAVVGDITLDDVLAKRDEINAIMRTKLDEVTERWGVKVTSVEIREILPPRSVTEAMVRQMAAERDRRAMVTKAEGEREAAIKVADGKKQAMILEAEGKKRAAILEAEGERQAAILRAEGYSVALQKIYEVARQIDPNTMALQYLEALKTIGQSPATKFIFPMEFTRLLGPISELVAKTTTRSSSGSEEGK